MSKFDETTEKKLNNLPFHPDMKWLCNDGKSNHWAVFLEKRCRFCVPFLPASQIETTLGDNAFLRKKINSTKASLEILARAVEDTLDWYEKGRDVSAMEVLIKARAQVKANFDWPLDD